METKEDRSNERYTREDPGQTFFLPAHIPLRVTLNTERRGWVEEKERSFMYSYDQVNNRSQVDHVGSGGAHWHF